MKATAILGLILASLGLKLAQAGIPQLVGDLSYAQDLAVIGPKAYWNEWPDVDPIAVPWKVYFSANTREQLGFLPLYGDAASVSGLRVLEIETDESHLYYLSDQPDQRRIGRRAHNNSDHTFLWPMNGLGMGTGRNLTLSTNWIVWADTTGLYRARKDGTGVVETIKAFSPNLTPSSSGLHLQASDTAIWWLDRFGSTTILRRKDLITSLETALGPLPSSTSWLQRRNGSVYFLVDGRQILSSDENTLPMPTLTVDESNPISGFLPWDDSIFWGLNTNGGVGIKRLTHATGSVDILSTVGSRATKLARSGNDLFWHSAAEQRIYRLALQNVRRSTADLAIAAMEVTQGIQSLQGDEQVPLIRDKETWVRIYPTATVLTGADFVTTTVALHGTGPSGPLPGSPLRPQQLLARVSQGQSPSTMILQADNSSRLARGVMEGSFNFRLPASWCQGSITLTANINPPEASGSRPLTESNLANNELSRAVGFSIQRPRLDVRCPGVRINQGGTILNSSFPPFEMARVADRLLHFMPVAEVNITAQPFLSTTYQWNTVLQSTRLVYDLHDRYPFDTYGYSGYGVRRFYAALPPNGISDSAGQVIGMAPYHSTASWNVLSLIPDAATHPRLSSPQLGVILAHELGHNIGIGHPGCTPAERQDPSWWDSNYPYPVTQFGPLGDDRFFWFDSLGNGILGPQEASDLMTYCRPLVPSDYFWRTVFPYITGSAWAQATGPASSTRFVQFSGEILGNGQVDWKPSTLLDQAWLTEPHLNELWNIQSPLLQNTGRCELAFYDSTGLFLGSQRFNPIEAHPLMDENASNDHHLELNHYFSVLLPETIGTSRIRLSVDDKFIEERTVSSHAPSLTLLTPTSGALVDKALDITWSANDLDGDVLSYTVQYSVDGGTTWALLAHRLTELQFKCTEMRLMPGSTGALIKVIATDGWNTSSAISEPFIVLPRSPEAAIAWPQSGATFQAGETIHFTGSGFDADEGSLPAEALFWRIVGRPETGQGHRWEVNDLPVGQYSVGLTAYDATQQSQEVFVNIVVSERAAPFTFTPQHPLLRAQPGTDPDSLTFSWDEWGQDFRLMTSADLNQWVPLSGKPDMKSGELQINLPQPSQRSYYKLERNP